MDQRSFNEKDLEILFSKEEATKDAPDKPDDRQMEIEIDSDEDQSTDKSNQPAETEESKEPEKPQDTQDMETFEKPQETKNKSFSKTKKPWKLYARLVSIFIGAFILTYLLINFSALYKNIRYYWDVNIRKQNYKQSMATPQPTAAFDPTTTASLIIPKIGVNAPIVWNTEEDQIDTKLLDGVVHFKGTALPGQKGNIFITGHSSYYSWVQSPYKDVFALLEKIAPEDQIYIQYQGANFAYKVTDTKVVSPKDISVMEPTNENNLTLMTCVPIGTNRNRLIISSVQIPN